MELSCAVITLAKFVILCPFCVCMQSARKLSVKIYENPMVCMGNYSAYVCTSNHMNLKELYAILLTNDMFLCALYVLLCPVKFVLFHVLLIMSLYVLIVFGFVNCMYGYWLVGWKARLSPQPQFFSGEVKIETSHFGS